MAGLHSGVQIMMIYCCIVGCMQLACGGSFLGWDEVSAMSVSLSEGKAGWGANAANLASWAASFVLTSASILVNNLKYGSSWLLNPSSSSVS